MDKIYHKTTWQNSPSTNTPINETNLNNIENGVDAIDSRVVDLGNTKSSVDWVQLQQSGDKIAEITIDGVKKAVYSKQASGSVLENALKSEGYAVGTQDGEPVSKSSPYYENNAKYYAEDSAKSSAESKYWSEKSGSSRLIAMDDVNITSPQDKQALVYDATTQKWINGQSVGGGTAKDTTYDNSKSGLSATNVQDATDELKENLNKKAEFKNYNSYDEALADINNIEEGQYVSTDGLSGNKFSIVEGNFGTITDGTIFNSDSAYPSGFNKDNCVVISFMIRDSNAQWKTPTTESSATSYHRSFVILNNTNIRACSNLSGHSNFAYKVCLMRTDI